MAGDPDIRLDLESVKAPAHPVRVWILEALQGRVASPVELPGELGESHGVVSHHMNVLRDLACVKQVQRGSSSTSTPLRPCHSSAIRIGAAFLGRCAAA